MTCSRRIGVCGLLGPSVDTTCTHDPQPGTESHRRRVSCCCLAGLNIAQRWSWRELEDGVLWKTDAGGDIVAAEIATGTAAERAGLARGDVLLVDRRPDRSSAWTTWSRRLHGGAARADAALHDRCGCRRGSRSTIDVAPVPSSPLGLYLALAAVGIFSLLVGASVRLRRPDHQATLHFFWLTVAFFGVMAFSFTGKLDPLDWTFYWGDLTAQLLLPPLFLHFALVFPDRPDAWVRSDTGRTLVPRDLPAGAAARRRVGRGRDQRRAARRGADARRRDWCRSRS